MRLFVLIALCGVAAGCDVTSADDAAVDGTLLVSWSRGEGSGRVRLETEDEYTCPPALAVRTRDGSYTSGRNRLLVILVDGLSGPLGACDAQGSASTEVSVVEPFDTYRVEVVHLGQTDLYKITDGAILTIEEVQTTVTRLGPR